MKRKKKWEKYLTGQNVHWKQKKKGGQSSNITSIWPFTGRYLQRWYSGLQTDIHALWKKSTIVKIQIPVSTIFEYSVILFWSSSFISSTTFRLSLYSIINYKKNLTFFSRLRIEAYILIHLQVNNYPPLV